MEFFVIVIVLTTLLCSAESAKPTKVQKRLNLLTARVNTLETRVNQESTYIQEVSDRVTLMNDSLMEHEAVCKTVHGHASTLAETEHTETSPIVSFQDTIERVLAAFTQEKANMRNTADNIDESLTELQHNITKRVDLNIQAVINDYTELKREVQNINLTLMDLQEEIQYIKSDQENTVLLSAELKELVSRVGLIGENYNEMKQNFKDIVTSFDNKYEPKKVECPSLWRRYGQFCYRVFDDSMIYSEAQRKCADSGAYVVDLLSQSEQDFITNLAKDVKYYWIGLTYIETEGSWKWDRTNSTSTYMNWRPGQPDGLSRKQHCVLVVLPGNASGKWNDQICRDKNQIVCKKSI